MQPTSNAFKAIVRSLTPWLLSTIAAVVAHFGYHVDPTISAQILVIAGTGLTVLVRMIETKFPWVGVFLGYLGAPLYTNPTKASLKAEIAQLEQQLAALNPQNPPNPTPLGTATASVTPADATVQQ